MHIKKFMQKFLVIICCVTILPMWDSLQISASTPTISTNNYIRVYPISTGNDTPAYTNKDCTQREGTIYANDEVYIYEIGQSGSITYAYCSYPLDSGGRKTRYVKLSSFSPNNASGINTAKGKVYTYRRSNLSQQYGYTEAGDTVWTIGKSGSSIQIIYTTGSLYKMGWVSENEYNLLISGESGNQGGNTGNNNVNQAAALVEKAQSQVGIKERSSGSDDILYNDWYYGRRVSNSYSAQYAWCAAFVSWCANEVGILNSIIPKENGTTRMKDKLINLGGTLHLKGSGYQPVAGDIIFFGNNASQHVGIVRYSSGNTVYYIDGNNIQTDPHGVHSSSCSLSYGSLYGFVTPNYAKYEQNSTEVNPPTIRAWISETKMGEVSEELYDGKWYYLCYELIDEATGRRFSSVAPSKQYQITETFYDSNGNVVNTCTYENSDNNWIGQRCSAGACKGVVTISGDYEGSCTVGAVVKILVTPTPIATLRPTQTPSPTPIATLKPTQTPSPSIIATNAPSSTNKPDNGSSITEEDSDDDQEELEVLSLEEGDTFEIENGYYEITDIDEDTGAVTYLSPVSLKNNTEVIPAAVVYEGIKFKVTAIDEEAFKNHKKLTSVTIGSNVQRIGAYAFYKAKKLESITIKSTKITKMGKKSFYGLKSTIKLKLPSKVKGKYKKMLKKAGLGKR